MWSLSLRRALAGACLVASAPAVAIAQSAPTVANLLELQPVLKGVEYEVPDKAAAAGCKTETVYDAQKNPIGVALRDAQGKLLRRFVDASGDKQMDRWSYYQDGFEVYRESDLNGDRSPDEARWFNSGGTRVASLGKGKVTAWKRISAEEAARVFVQGVVAGDLSLIESVMATPEDLAALGVPKAGTDQAAAAARDRVAQVRALQKELVGWTKGMVGRFDGQMPHLIPGDALGAPDKEIVLYESAVIIASPGNGQAPAGKVSFLQVPEVVKVGDAWKFVELPRAIDPEKPMVAAEGGVRSSVYRQQAAGNTGEAPEVEAALRALAEYDNANAKLQVEGGKKEVAQFHVGRIPLLRAVVKGVKSADDRLVYDKQIADSLAAAYQTGFFPKGVELLDGLSRGGGPLASYAAFRKVSAEFTAKNDEPGANLMVNQKSWMADLKAFLEAHPKSEEAPEALLQLGSASEFNAEEEDARKYYKQLADGFPQTDPGKKAAGALRRLDLVGKALALRGPGLKGETLDVAQFKGKALLVAFWAGWAEPVKADLPELLKVYQKYHGRDFEVLGVDLDNDRADLDAFLKDNPLPWPQIFEPGGTDKSRLAVEYGIIALPTMVLIDAEGKVVNRNIRTAADLDRQLEKLLGAKQAGVARRPDPN